METNSLLVGVTLHLDGERKEVTIKALEMYKESVSPFFGEGMYTRPRKEPDYTIVYELLQDLKK